MSKLPSVMGNRFAQIPSVKMQRSKFDRSCGYKTTFQSGYLIPVLMDEVLPGDSFSLESTFLCRMSTPTFPIMDNMKLDFHVFYVPNRLLWTNWQKFCGELTDPGDLGVTEYLVPVVTTPVGGHLEDTLWDYFGIPTGIDDMDPNALHSRAYNFIYNEYYRDQNLQDSVVVDTDDGPDTDTDYVLLRRNKRHDYFTSCLPWPQKRTTGVALPLTGNAPITGIGARVNTSPYDVASQAVYETGGTGTTTYTASSQTAGTSRDFHIEEDPNNAGFPGIYADLTSVTAATINDIREAFQLQRLYEKDARGGTRYTEILNAHFGVTSPDARLQRPEYLGGCTTDINISPVAQTGATETGKPQGNLAAFATGLNKKHVFNKSFVEHGVLLGLISVRADLTYQQGLERMWSRQTRVDFYWPTLAHLGEQSVLNKEIYAQGTAADDNVFGYQERYAEYRYKTSLITGAFRSNHSTTLDAWHLSQEFGALPTLGDTFIQENPPLDRILAVSGDIEFRLDCFHNLKCVRPMPVYSVPGMIDHF